MRQKWLRFRARFRQIRPDFVQQWAGIILISAGAALFSVRAGLLVAGVLILAAGAIAEAGKGSNVRDAP